MASLLDTLGKTSEISEQSLKTPGDPQPSSSRTIAKIDNLSDSSLSGYKTKSNEESLPRQFAIGERLNTPKKEPIKYQ
ncbi:hypothetical protein Bca4012_098521 [Brassica carinata]